MDETSIATPSAMVLVPIEPTDAMRQAIYDLLSAYDDGSDISPSFFMKMLINAANAGQSRLNASSVCQRCGGSGEQDSGGVQPWGEGINIPCDCDRELAPPTPLSVNTEE
jgi:hypothetical protein